MSEPILINRDEEHLRLLAIGHYVFGGCIALISCLGIFYFIFGIVMLVATATHRRSGDVPPAVIGGVFCILGAMVVVVGVTAGLLWVFTGRSLANRRRYVFCMVMAAIACLSMPFGTVLGVFTIMVLTRPSVTMMFGQSATPASG